MRVIWKKTAEELQREVLGMHFTRIGIEKIMDVLAENAEVVYEAGDIAYLEPGTRLTTDGMIVGNPRETP